MAEILVAVNPDNYTHPEPEKDRMGVYKKGYPVVIMPDGHIWGSSEALPKFVIVKVTDATVEEITNYLDQWTRRLDWEVVSSNPVKDGWRLRVFCTNPGNSGLGGITRVMVENFIVKWGGEVKSVAANSVTFDIAILDAIKSESFWRGREDGLIIIENSYDQGTGVHEIEVDYSSSLVSTSLAEGFVIFKKGTIIAHDTGIKKITFQMTRHNVLDAFKAQVRGRLEVTLYRRQFRIDEVTIDNIINNYDGVISVTKSQLVSYIKNRLDDVSA